MQNRQVISTHHDRNRGRIIIGETHVAIGYDTYNTIVLVNDREPSHAIAFLQCFSIGKRLIGAQCDWVIDYTALKTLDAADLTGLLFNRKIAVNNTNPTRLRHGNRHTSLGNGIHCRTQQRDIHRYRLGYKCPRISRRWQHIGSPRNKQNIIKGQSLTNLHIAPRMQSVHLAVSFLMVLLK